MQPAPPPPPAAPFSPPSSSASHNGGPNRLSNEFRASTAAAAAAPTTSSQPPLPVPSSSSSSSATTVHNGSGHGNGNGHSRNLSGFDMAARSPPNQSSKIFHFPNKGENLDLDFMHQKPGLETDGGRYKARSLQILSAGCLSGRPGLSVFTFY